ncbi:MAG TPA: sugar kinase [Actinomycetota bacterium]|jgi:sugar/nucleoside kinase (ribokinase family)
MSGFDIVVLGDANPDLILRGGDVVPAFGQAERLVDEATLTVGGSGGIFACAAARLGLSVAFVGVVGDDRFGRYMCEELEANGVNTDGVVTDQDRPTGVTVVLSTPTDRAMLTALGTVGDLRADRVDPAILAQARHVHVSSYYLQRSLAPDLPRIFAEVRAAGATTSVDPNWDPSGRWDDALLRLLASVDVFLPNEMEALSLAHISELDRAIARLREAGAGVVVVKRDGDGAVAADGSGIVRIEGHVVPVVDGTGAGDAFDAGFLASWLAGEPLERSLAVGNACGAAAVGAPGGTAALSTMDEALELAGASR